MVCPGARAGSRRACGYSNTVIGILAVDGWAVTCGTTKRGLGGHGLRSVSSLLYQL